MKQWSRISSVALVLVLVSCTASIAGGVTAERCGACKSEMYGLNSLWQFCPVCGKPLDRALRSKEAIRTLATCVEAYALDHRALPQSRDVAGLATAFQPVYVKVMPAKDGWGRDLAYRVAGSGDRYVFGSPGENGIWEKAPEEYLSAAPGTPPVVPPGSDDLVLVDGAFAEAVKLDAQVEQVASTPR